MNVRALRSLGIALLLAAGLLAALLAAGMGAPAGVGAHDCDPDGTTDMHVDFQAKPVPCSTPTHQKEHAHTIEVDGGRYREMTFKAYVPSQPHYYDQPNDSIVITFHRSFDLPETVPLNENLITVDDSGDGSPVNVTDVSVNGKELILTGGTYDVSAPTVEDREYITITIKAGAGIETPETPQGFDDYEGEKPYEVFITFVDGDPPNGEVEADDKNFVIVKNPIDSTVPNTSVRVELHTYAEADISTADDISVDFSGPSADSGFDLPSTMATSRIKVFYGAGTDSFNPSEVQIEGERVIFSVPAKKDESQISFIGDYRIEFSKLARVKTPLSAGIKPIRVSSSVDGDDEDIIEAVVRRTTTVSPKGGPRGSEFTLEGKGYAPGTVTVYHDADGDETIDAGETLASVKTVRGAFRTNLTARGNPGEEQYRVRARDSEGDDVSVGFDIRSAMSFDPNPVGLGSSLKIIISDWEAERNEVVAFQIAGKGKAIANAVEYENCIDHPGAARRDSKGAIILTVDVPSVIPLGEQTVAVYDHYQLDYENAKGEPIEKKSCHDLDLAGETWGAFKEELRQAIITDDPIAVTKATVEIVAESLTLSPAAVVKGQRVTITGSGFTQATGGVDDFSSVSINGIDVEEDLSEFEVSTTGNFAFKVTVPQGAPIGDNEVRVVGWDHTLGQATLEVLGAAITLDRAESRRGTRVEFTGVGFIANELFRVWYGDGGDVFDGDIHLGSGRADASGRIEFTFDVPLTAPVGRVQKVTVESQGFGADGQTTVSAEAEHTVPAGTITTTPYRVSPGDRFTIRGEDLPAFSLIRSIELEGRDITPLPNPSTERDGTFEVEITVPQIEFGDLTLRIDASGVLITHIVEVGPPPLSGNPAEVFKGLIRAGALVRIWRLEPETQEWFFFDPREAFAVFNTLKTIDRETVVVLIVNEIAEFRGQPLTVGSNFVFVD